MGDHLPMVGDNLLFDAMERGDELAARVLAVFPNQGLHMAARAVASAHPRAIQYLEQAPVIALATHGRAFKPNAAYMRHKLRDLCEAGAPLKTVMRAFGYPAPLRRLRGYAFVPSSRAVVDSMKGLDLAMLGRVIPERPGLQRRWLAACAAWRQHVWIRSPRSGPDLVGFAWAVEMMARAGVGPQDAGHVADFAIAPAEHFNTAWQWPRAVEEAHRWHARLTVDRALTGTPFTRETALDLAEHPNTADHDGFTFLALRTPLDICEEGAAMRHCVATYLNAVASGRSHIVSMQRGGKRIATLELNRDWQRVQCKGKANAQPGGDALTAADHYAFAVRKALKHPSTLGGA